ncbi:TPA: hypothetical protein DEP96_01110 [Candidatus Uhrbacteria bacterium]|nr:hypothetical protein [Candidatus Uhrbacteria bacterium]
MIEETAIQIIWDYHHVNQELLKADIMLVLGSHDLRVAEYAARLWLQGLAPLVVVSGGVAHTDDLLKTDWAGTEAAEFAGVMAKAGVPIDKITLEQTAKNTSENFSLSRPIIERDLAEWKTVIVVTKPYMERRAYATGAKLWLDKELIVTSPKLSFEEYVGGAIIRDDVINLMMGDLQRIDVYGKKGWQIEQIIPTEVWTAFEELKKLGYTKHLLTEE